MLVALAAPSTTAPQCLGHRVTCSTTARRPTGLRYCNDGCALKFHPRLNAWWRFAWEADSMAGGNQGGAGPARWRSSGWWAFAGSAAAAGHGRMTKGRRTRPLAANRPPDQAEGHRLLTRSTATRLNAGNWLKALTGANAGRSLERRTLRAGQRHHPLEFRSDWCAQRPSPGPSKSPDDTATVEIYFEKARSTAARSRPTPSAA